MGRDLSEALLFVRCQIGFLVLWVAAHQVYFPRHNNIQVDDPRAATLPFALGCPSQFPDAPRTGYHVACVRMANQINCYCVDTLRSD